MSLPSSLLRLNCTNSLFDGSWDNLAQTFPEDRLLEPSKTAGLAQAPHLLASVAGHRNHPYVHCVTVSGVVLMYYGMPQLTAGERLMRMQPLDLSTATITPAEAATIGKIKPTRLRVSMHNGRPVYRFTRSTSAIGQWTVIYADTGEKLPDIGREEAMSWMRSFAPEYAATMRYDAYLESPDEFTRIPTLAGFVPLHRIAMGDAANTEYYVAEKSGEIILKTDTRSRILGFSGYIMHNLFFFRQRTWWEPLMWSLTWIGIIMGVTGVVVGIWRIGLRARFRHKGVPSHTPYVGWMKWHHIAGLIFGLSIFTWIVSGAIPVPAFPVPHWDQVAKRAARMGDGHITGTPQISPATSMSKEMIQAVTGGPLNVEPVTLEGLRQSVAAIQTAFTPTEIELLQFRANPYFIAYKPPSSQQEADRWVISNAINFLAIAQENEHVLVSATTPGQGVFKRFSNDVMEQAAREAMPDAPVRDIEWLNDYDNYYHKTVASFELGLLKPAYTLPCCAFGMTIRRERGSISLRLTGRW